VELVSWKFNQKKIFRATNFKDAVEKDVNEKTDHMKRCRTELEAAMANDDEDLTFSSSS